MFKQIVFMAIGLFMFSTLVSAEIKLVDGSNNVLALNVEGTWSLDMELAERLHGKDSKEMELFDLKVIFVEDKKVLDVLNSKENGKTLKYKVYSVGKVNYSGEPFDFSYYYAVVNRDGNSTLAVFNPDEKEGKGDWEFSNAMLAKAEKSKSDLLFLGGDRASEPMFPLKRAVK